MLVHKLNFFDKAIMAKFVCPFFFTNMSYQKSTWQDNFEYDKYFFTLDTCLSAQIFLIKWQKAATFPLFSFQLRDPNASGQANDGCIRWTYRIFLPLLLTRCLDKDNRTPKKGENTPNFTLWHGKNEPKLLQLGISLLMYEFWLSLVVVLVLRGLTGGNDSYSFLILFVIFYSRLYIFLILFSSSILIIISGVCFLLLKCEVGRKLSNILDFYCVGQNRQTLLGYEQKNYGELLVRREKEFLLKEHFYRVMQLSWGVFYAKFFSLFRWSLPFVVFFMLFVYIF